MAGSALVNKQAVTSALITCPPEVSSIPSLWGGDMRPCPDKSWSLKQSGPGPNSVGKNLTLAPKPGLSDACWPHLICELCLSAIVWPMRSSWPQDSTWSPVAFPRIQKDQFSWDSDSAKNWWDIYKWSVLTRIIRVTILSIPAFPSICQKVGFAFPRREGLRRGSARLVSLSSIFSSFCHSVRVTHLSQYRARCVMGHMWAKYAHGIPPGIPWHWVWLMVNFD